MLMNMDQKWKKRLVTKMEERGFNKRSLSLACGFNETQVRLLLSRSSNPKIETVEALCEVLGVSVSYFMYGHENMQETPIIGTVSAGSGHMNFDDEENNGTVMTPQHLGKVYAVKIEGNSMFPRYEDGWMVAFGAKAASLDEVIDKECVVLTKDGEHYLKTLKHGTKPGTATLGSYNWPDIENVEIEWAAKLVDWIKRGD